VYSLAIASASSSNVGANGRSGACARTLGAKMDVGCAEAIVVKKPHKHAAKPGFRASFEKPAIALHSFMA
jgi:hypothetical protein